jgi:hypothetical protein
VRRLDRGDISPVAGYLTAKAGWADALGPEDLPGVLRSAMREEYADASDAEMAEALENVLDALSPAEAFNFGSALSQIGRSASKLAADPTFQQVVRTAAPVAGGALGTFIGGPIGTALGSQLGNLAVRALPAPAAPAPRVAPAPAAPPAPPSAPALPPPPVPPPEPRPAAPAPIVPAPVSSAAAAAAPITPVPTVQPVATLPVPSGAPAPPPAVIPAALSPASSVAGGSAAAAQGLVLTQQSDVLQGLLATALGKHGCQRVSGIPAAQLLALLSRVFEQAAADADALMYLGQQADVSESVPESAPADSVRSLYGDLIGADNLELAEAAWEGLG